MIARLAMLSVIPFLRNVFVLLIVALVVLYLASVAYLYAQQRRLLFARGREETSIGEIYRVLHISEQDGTKIAAWFAPAATNDAPIIVFFYGNAGTLSDFADVGQQFHSEGYGILLASYRGYSGNMGEPSEAGLMADARATLDSAPLRGHRIVLWGQSLGTGLAVRMAAEGRGAALILQSPYTSIVDVAAAQYPLYPVRWLMKDRFDSLSLAGGIDLPVLIMHGTADELVPFAMGETLARAFPHATLIPIAGGTHDLEERRTIPIARDWLRNTAKMPP